MATTTTTTTRGITFEFSQFWERGGSHEDGTFLAPYGRSLVFLQQGGLYTNANYSETFAGQTILTVRITGVSITPAAMDAIDSPGDLYDAVGNITFRGGTGDDYISLGDGNDVIHGGDGNDHLVSSLGIFAGSDNDKLYGGAGDDILDVRFGRDYVAGGAGTDTISLWRVNGPATIDLGRTTWQAVSVGDGTADLSVQLSSVENVSGSSYGDRIKGSAFANVLRGNDGDDTLDGGRGNDTLDGGSGSDTADYSAFTASTVNLSLTSAQHTGAAGSDLLISIENLIGGTGIDHFTGNVGANTLSGRGGDDYLFGGGGNDALLGGVGHDTLLGGAGTDTLAGEQGNDVLNGGAGADVLIGGAGADRFAFASISEANGDLIVDFLGSQGDRIDLRLIDADTTLGGNQAFAFIGASGFTGVAGQLRYQTTSPYPGTPVFVMGDVNGDGQADFSITIQAPAYPYPTAGDFLL